MEEFPSNSRASKEQPPEPARKVEKVIVGEVVTRKKPLGKRFAESFFGGTAKGVGQYIAMEVLLPSFKDVVVDAFTQAIERFFYGDARPNSRRPGSRPGMGHVNYSGYSSSSRNRPEPRREEPRSMTRRGRESHNFDEILLPSRAEADEVISKLHDLVVRYDSASVSDLYQMVGLSPTYADEKWGWTNLDEATYARTRVGGEVAYVLDLPRPEPLN